MISFQNVESDLDFYYHEYTKYKTQHLFPTLPYKPNRASDLNLYMFIAALPSLIAKLLKFAHFLRTKFHSHITKTLEVYQH